MWAPADRAPALASVLSARTIPDDGGEREFVSTRLAWDRLSDEQREELRDLVVVHSYATSWDQIDPALMTPAERAALPAVRWRLIWRNPVNARDALYIASHAGAIEGMDDANPSANARYLRGAVILRRLCSALSEWSNRSNLVESIDIGRRNGWCAP